MVNDRSYPRFSRFIIKPPTYPPTRSKLKRLITQKSEREPCVRCIRADTVRAVSVAAGSYVKSKAPVIKPTSALLSITNVFLWYTRHVVFIGTLPAHIYQDFCASPYSMAKVGTINSSHIDLEPNTFNKVGPHPDFSRCFTRQDS